MGVEYFKKKSALFIFIIHWLIAIFFFLKTEDHPLYYWVMGIFILTSIPYLVAYYKNKYIAYEAIYVYFIGILLNYTLRFVLDLHLIDLPLETVNTVLKLIFFGLIFFFAGYYLPFSKMIANKLPTDKFTMKEEKIVKLPIKLYIIAWLLRLSVTFGLGILDSFRGWLIISLIMRSGVYLALLIDSYFLFSKNNDSKKPFIIRMVIFLVLEFIWSFQFGMKEYLILPLIFVFVGYIKARKKIPYVSIISAALIFVLFVMPFVQTWRTNVANYGNDYAKEIAFEEVFNRDKTIDSYAPQINRLSDSINVATIAYDFHQEGRKVSTYQGWKDYLSRFIPRFLWPDKPSVDYNQIGKDLGILAQDDYHTAWGLSSVAAFILSNGAFGVFLGMFLTGIIIKTYWEWLIINCKDNLLALLIYFPLMYPWFRDEAMGIVFNGNMAFLFYAFILLYFINKK